MIDQPYIHLVTMEVKMLSEFPADTLLVHLSRVRWNGRTWQYV